MPKLLYQGNGSCRLTADDGRVIYLDPYAGEGYDLPADLILVTHQHHDHNQVHRCTQKQTCRIITNVEALEGGRHNRFELDGIIIQAAEARNRMHSPKKCVGYLITLNGTKLYASGDTSKTAQMADFAALELDYALFPGDGVFNMGPRGAAACARLCGARHNILIHVNPFLSHRKIAEKWTAPNKLTLLAGEEIAL